MSFDFSKAKNVKQAEAREKYLTPGLYRLKVQRNLIKQTRDRKDLWIAEFEVIASNNPEHPVGCTRAWIQNISDPEIGFRAVNAYAYSALGLDPKDSKDSEKITKDVDPIIDQILASATENPSDPSCKNAFKGFVVDCEVTQISTKSGHPFSLHKYRPVKG